MGLVCTHDVLDGDEGHREGLVAVGDVEQVDVAGLLDDSARFDAIESDAVHALEPGGEIEAVRTDSIGAGQGLVSFAAIAFDDQRVVLVDEVEAADGRARSVENVAIVLVDELPFVDVELQHPQDHSLVHHLRHFSIRNNQRSFEQQIQVPPVRRRSHALEAPAGPMELPAVLTLRKRVVRFAPNRVVAEAGLEEPGDPAVAIGPQQERSELLTDVNVIANGLNGLRIEITARQVPFLGVLIDDLEWQDVVRVVKE